MPSAPQPAISILQLRISLRGQSPPVWRRVLVPEHMTLGQLHNVIQVVMAWTDEHKKPIREPIEKESQITGGLSRRYLSP
jgi:hypothetical protein